VDPRIRKYREAASAMKNGVFRVDVPIGAEDEVGLLGRTLLELGRTLESKFREINTLARLTEKINSGLVLEEILDQVFESFRPLIPYDRIGLALLEEDGKVLRARWARSVSTDLRITHGYAAPMKGSSLLQIIQTGQPRILNDLESYLSEHPESESTRLIVAEGMRSSLTCPLVAMGKPVGFMFFSSMQLQTYRRVHVDLFKQIAGQLSLIVEKGRMYQELVELNQLKSKFLGMAVHDLRNPLNVVNGYLELLLNNYLGALPEEQRVFIERSYGACKSMSALLEDLLDISAIEAGALELELEEHNVVDVITEAYRANSVLASAKEISMELNVEDGLQPVLVDGKRMGQVMNNLISNAIKYSYPKTSIRLRAQPAPGGVEIVVHDEGQGIPSHELTRIFRAFGRGTTKPTGGEKSTGLGLAIVSRIVKAHKGSVRVKSNVGQGSTFTVFLPRSGPRKRDPDTTLEQESGATSVLS
jgi:signal transduction histidine kinase